MLGDFQVDQKRSEKEQVLQQTIKKTLPIKDLPSTLTCLSIYDDYIYVGTNEFKTYIYHVRSSPIHQQPLLVELKSVIQSHCQIVNLIAASEDWLIIVPYGEQKQELIRVWKRKQLQLFVCLKGHTKKISKVIFLDSLHIATVSYDGIAKVWLINKDAQLNTLVAQCDSRYPILTITEISDEVVAFGGDNCIVTVWNWRKNYVISRSFGHLGSVSSLFTAYNGVYSLGGDTKLKKWTLQQQSGLHLQRIFQHNLHNIQFVLNLGNSQYFLIDNKGKTALIQNKRLYLGSVSIKYTQTIKDMLLYENSILLVLKTSKKQYVCSFNLSQHISHMHNNPQKGNPFHMRNAKTKNTKNIRLIISWCKLSSHDQQIINLQGIINTGQHLTVISSTGSQSSSLFMKCLYRLLTQNGADNDIDGQVIVNGRELSHKVMARITVFAKIDAVFLGRLNVYQTLKFAIRLKNWSLSQREQENLCRKIIKLMKLQNIKHKKIDETKPGNLSLFHKKLLQISILLIQNPRILFLSSIQQNLTDRECLTILKILANVAKSQSMIIINDINPPPYTILRQLQKIYLIKESQCVYSGKVQNILDNLGQKFHYKKITVLQYFLENHRHLQHIAPIQRDQYDRINAKNSEQQISQTTQNKIKLDELIMINKPQITLKKECWELLKCHLKISWVKSHQLFSKFIITVLIPVLIGSIFLGFGKNFTQLDTISNQRILSLFNFIFLSQASTLYCSYLSTHNKYTRISQSINNELKSSLYSSTSLSLSLITFQMLDKFVLGVISSFILLGAFDINFQSTRIIVFISIIIVINIFGAYLGIIFSFRSQIFRWVFTAVFLFVTFFNGILCNITDTPSYTRWIMYLSPLRYTLILALQDLLGSSSFAILRDQGIQSLYGFDEDYSITLTCSLIVFAMAPIYLAYTIHSLQRSG